MAGAHLARRPALDGRGELGRLAALLGASALAIAQPVLDAFGKSPETFVFRNAAGLDLVLFAVVIVVVPPLALWALGVVVGRFLPRWRGAVHGASMGGLLGLAVVQLLADAARPVALLVAGLAALAGWVLSVKAKGFQLWSQLLAGLAVMALVAFLALSPASDLVANREFEAVAAQGGAAPVVLIVLDELPTASIVDASGTIDATRFPNLARLARQGTWYRNHTTQAGFTTEAVPAIYTGQTPTGGAPVFTVHPDNIFRLLADSHELVVSEAITQLCPTSVCGDHPTAPGEPVVDEPRGTELGALFGDAVDLWWQRVRGADAAGEGGVFGQFAEDVSSGSPVLFGSGETPGAVGTFQTEVENAPDRLLEFLAALQPSDRPIAAVLHLVSPHFPWRRLPDGTLYAAPADEADLPINGGNGGVPWVQDLERQRHLWQAGYTDALVGEVLDRVEEIGMWDDAAIVVTADHGVAFHGDENRRLPVEAALPELMWTPLIVKAPGQTGPAVDDSNVQTIDILPTIASLIGVDIPWDVDGVVPGSDAQRARGDAKELYRFDDAADPDPPPVMHVEGGDDELRDVLGTPYPPEDPDDPLGALHSLSGHGDLVGQPFQPTGQVAGGTFVVDDLDELLRKFERPLVLSGTVAGGRVGDDAVVAVADGRIVAVSPVVFRNIGGAAFVMILPPDGSAGLGELRLALVRGDELLDAGPIVD